MICILGLLPENEAQNYQLTNLTNHVEFRKFRLNLIISLNVLYYFEVYRFEDKSRQIHCLLEDSTLVVFNKKTGKAITVILADQDLLYKYINRYDLEKDIGLKLSRCSALNKKYQVNKKKLEDGICKEYLEKKRKIFK